MLKHASWLLQWSRMFGQRVFLRFGLHCATHQIRIILVSCVVITSLFYPALALYSSSQPKSLSMIDSFISPTAVSGFDIQDDLVNLWSCHDTLRLHEDAVSRAKCGVGRALRVERILIQSTIVEDDGALNHQILLSTLDLENRLEGHISNGETPCLKQPDGKCFVLSPLLFWNHDKKALLSDPDILDTLNSSKNVSVGGILITPHMVLVGRRSNEHHLAGSKFEFARFLSLTYFFPESDCLGNHEHALWLQAIRRVVAQNDELTIQLEEPTLITLEYDPNLSKGEGWSALSAFLYLAYIGFFAYVAWSVRRMNGVHSRLGVTFTALVEITVSTITSLSVCALVGFKVTMVPWELLPIVIVFVGAENMFNLVDAVAKTSVALSVKQRIAEGLSRAGTSNTLKVVSYNVILGVIAVFTVGAVRQFCVFAIVVLVAHWFLAHTFFMAVLSIDIQRLELDELLRYDSSSLAPTIPSLAKDSSVKKPRKGWRKLVLATHNLLESRAATNLSLVMLLAMTATLYYTTYSVTPSIVDPVAPTPPLGAVSHPGAHFTEYNFQTKPTAWHIWKTFNPNQTPLLHLRIEHPTIVTFRPDIDDLDQIKQHKTHRPRFSMRTFYLFLWLLKIMVLPIAATTSILWGLLLYLLKDAELLEAQRHRGDPEVSDTHEVGKRLESRITFSTLPRAFSSDIELIAASKDGKVIVSVGLQNEIMIWRTDTQSYISIDVTEVLHRPASTSCAASTLTSIAVDEKGNYCAVGTGAGLVAIWVLGVGGVRPLPLLALENSSAGVTEIQFGFANSQTPEILQPKTEPVSPGGRSGTEVVVLATYENGVAAKWSLIDEDFPTITYFTPSHRASVVRCSLLYVHPLDRYLIAFCLDDGIVELVDAHYADPLLPPDYHIQAGTPADAVSKVHSCQTVLGGSTRLVIAAATEAGSVSLWDGSTSECISILEEAHGRINHLRVSPVDCDTCHLCGQLPLESFSIVFSVNHVVQFYKLYINDQTRRCSCYRHQLRHVSSRDSLGRRSRSNSTAISHVGSASPSTARARLATNFEMSAFPVSGHGIHSKRVSEKDIGRRSSETITVPFLGEDSDSSHVSGGLDTSRSRILGNSLSSYWQSAVVVRVMDITCERGGWGVFTNRRVFGLRRKSRTQGNMLSNSITESSSAWGLTAATLGRWELWTFDPSIPQLQTSLLAALATKSAESSCPANFVPRLPFTRVSPLLISHSHALAGFGNTVGLFSFSDS